MSWFEAITEATKDVFLGAKDLNPCEDQFMAGVRGDPYPANDQPYDCGQAYFDGQASQQSSHFGDSSSSDAGSGSSDSSFGGSDSSSSF